MLYIYWKTPLDFLFPLAVSSLKNSWHKFCIINYIPNQSPASTKGMEK